MLVAVSVVKAPVEAVDEPIAVPSIFPPLTSALVIVDVPVDVRSVKVPVEAEFAPIAVPSTAPPFISTVDHVDVPVAVKSVVVVPPLAVNAPVKVDVPVTPNVPPIVAELFNVEFPSTYKLPPVVVDPPSTASCVFPLTFNLSLNSAEP